MSAPKCTLPQFRTYEQGVEDGWRQAIRAAWRIIDDDNDLSEPKAGTPRPSVARLMDYLDKQRPKSANGQ